MLTDLSNCTLCPRNCNIDRYQGAKGYCRVDAGLNIASICIHKGEEPVIGGIDGICNIFFSGCNLRCIYCQNHEISQPDLSVASIAVGLSQRQLRQLNNFERIISKVTAILSTGINSLGFVSPSHMIPQMLRIISGIHEKGFKPVIIYNSNGYDNVETIRNLNGIIDVYLPDFKYINPDTAFKYSGARNYPEVSLKAIKEMYYQKGSTLLTDENGKAESGLLIRHLVLPGHIEESKKVLDSIAENLSTGVNISLMSQYHPIHKAVDKAFFPLNRTLYASEYESVVNYMQLLGFRNGWIQAIESSANYLPDFSKDNPFG
ncbi:MAG TPA: radical SAM protein [Bacteroidales bacterium]|nr:radical SAM protein [Bacteroidales bacterium]